MHLQRRADRQLSSVFVEHITIAWRQCLAEQRWPCPLSLAAQQALRRLLVVGTIPAALFTAQYGAIRRPGESAAGLHAAVRPWRHPQNVSEELYYVGLLHPTNAVALKRAERLIVPTDLQPGLRGLLGLADQEPDLALPAGTPGHERQFPPMQLMEPPFVLLHDLTQWLLLLHHQQPRLQHNRWLARRSLLQLNPRLLRAMPTLTTQRRAPWLAFLSFLATATGLVDQGRLTPLAWAWLAYPPAQQVQLLWQGWRMAPAALRLAFAQPGWHWPDHWLAPQATSLLPLLGPAFTARQLANQLLGDRSLPTAYFNAHFADLAALDDHCSHLLSGPLYDLGLVDVTESATAEPYFCLSALGRWLLAPSQQSAPDWRWPTPRVEWQRLAGAAAEVTEQVVAWRLALPATTAPWLLLRLATYAHAEPPSRDDEGRPIHSFRLDQASVAAAGAAHHGWPGLLEVGQALAWPLTPAQLAQLQQWHAQGRVLQLQLLPVVRTATPAHMQQLQQTATLRRFWGELLSPTAAVWVGEPAAFVRALQQAGFFPSTPPPALPPSARPTAAAPLLLGAAERGALWLAAQLYQMLGDHLPLPLPLPTSLLLALADQLPPAEQAALQAQLERLSAHLLDQFDQLPYSPPPHPSDPAQWQAVLQAAIAQGRALTIDYFSAGRNLLTRRRIEPCWIETQHGILYLRAYCHNAGHYLTFRLDRIQAIEE